MNDPQSTVSQPSARSPERQVAASRWNEVGAGRFAPRPSLRDSLPWIALILCLAGAVLALLVAMLSPPHRGDGPRYPLPSYVYANGHCHHRSRAGMVSAALCEDALSKPGSDGKRQPRFVYEPAERVCYDTILDVRHKVPTEFCNRRLLM